MVARVVARVARVPLVLVGRARAWEKQVLSARGFKRVGRHSEYAVYTARRKRPRGFK